jgi:inorganic pyrophosphatase
MESEFWNRLDELVQTCGVVIDRPKGSSHPRYPTFVYPFDYGYLPGTLAADGGGIDVWRGSQPEQVVTGVICTIDMNKKDAELKILVGCTPAEAQVILKTHNECSQSGILIARSD